MNYNLVKYGNAPIINMLYGAGIGLGAGALIDHFLDNKSNKKKTIYEKLKKPLLLAAIGAIPGLAQGGIQYINSMGNKGHKNLSPVLNNSLKWYEPFTSSSEELKEKSPTYKATMNAIKYKYKLNTKYDDPANIPETSLDKKFNKKNLGLIYPDIPLY